MLVASFGYASFGYAVNPESIPTLQQLLTALNALPAAWVSKIPANPYMIAGEDVPEPQLYADDPDFLLWPSAIWDATQDAWYDVSTLVDAGNIRDFALTAPTVLDAKNELVELLQDYQALMEPQPPVSVPAEPVPAEPAPVPAPVPAPAPPTPTPTPTTPTPTPTPTLSERWPSWPWLVGGVIGIGVIIILVAKTATGPESDTRYY